MHEIIKFSAVLVLAVSSLHAADGKKVPLTQALALKLGPEDLTKFTDQSEAGQDNAAGLYAAAKRIETEHALAQRDLKQVIELQEWRVVIGKCRRGSCSLAYIVNGGGTMYSHGQARDCAPLEDFLAALAKRLPLAGGKGDAKAEKQVDDAIAFIKKLKPLDLGDAESNKEANARLAEKVKEVAEHWESLKYLIKEISAAEARRIAAFAEESLGWLKEGEGK